MKKENQEVTRENLVFLSPGNQVLEVKGKLFYNEGSQAWSIIRLKRNILYEFPQLRDKRNKVSYKMIMHDSIESLKNMIKDIEKNGGKVPVLLFFCKDES